MRAKNLGRMITAVTAAGIILTGCSLGGGDKEEESTPKKVVQEEPSTTKKQEETETTEEHTDKETETETVTEPATEEERGYDERVEFMNSAFLGDSRTAGLNEKLVVGGADFYTSVGTTVKDVVEKKNFPLSNGSMGTMLDAVAEENYDRLYVMFGINELGWPSEKSFAEYYTTIINTLKRHFPNSKIYVQSILPMVENRTDETYNNEKIRLFNTSIQEVAEATGVQYIDVAAAVCDETGALPEVASNDGIHLSREYCFKWAEYLKEQTELLEQQTEEFPN